MESVCLEIIKPKSKPFLLNTVYRPPSSNANFMDDLENYLHTLDEQDKELILTGDLNCDKRRRNELKVGGLNIRAPKARAL